MNRTSLVICLAASMVATVGCTSKNYVKNQTTPLINKTNELDDLTAKNTRDIKDVDARAQAAIQQGRFVGKLIGRQLKGRDWKHPFHYVDKGNMAVVGKNFAILESGFLRTSGFVTWLIWIFLHLMSLPQLQNRMRVQTQWFWSYFTGQRSSRLIPELPRQLSPVVTAERPTSRG